MTAITRLVSCPDVICALKLANEIPLHHKVVVITYSKIKIAGLRRIKKALNSPQIPFLMRGWGLGTRLCKDRLLAFSFFRQFSYELPLQPIAFSHLYFLECLLLRYRDKDTDGLLAGSINLLSAQEDDLTEGRLDVCVGLQL